MIELLRKFLDSSKELEIEYNVATQFFRDEKETEINSSLERSEELVSATENIIEDLKSGLEGFKDYRDSKRLKAVEDVSENFYKSRMKIIDSFNPSPNPEQHLEDTREFLDEFEDLTRKEAAVMDRVKKDLPELFKAIEQLNSHLAELEEFVEEDYGVVRTEAKLEELTEEVKELENSIEQTGKEKEDIDMERTREKIQGKEEELEQLMDSEAWEEKKQMEERRKDLKDRRKSLLGDLSKNVSKMERGLKKVVYTVENQGTSFKGDLGKLEKIRNEEFRELEEPEKELEEALKLVEDKKFIGDRQIQRFREAVESMKEFDSRMGEIHKLEKEIEELKQQSRNLDVRDRKKSIEKEKKVLEEKLDEKEEQKKLLEERLEGHRTEREQKLDDIEKLLNSSTRHEVELEETN